MAYFALPYRVLFHDTMAQGSHHFLTNFKFQCEAREHFFFGLAQDSSPAGKALLETLDLITLDAYSRNLAPVAVGEKVGILMTVEDQTPSAFRLCFRVVRHDGKPVACGFQSVLCTSRQTGHVMVSPEPVYVFAPLKEKLRQPSFRDRVLAGGQAVKDLFDEDAIRIAVSTASTHQPRLVPDILLPPTEHLRRREEAHGVVFLFPGQGSWAPAFLTEIQRRYPGATPLLRQMDRIAAAQLGDGFLDACADESANARITADNPDVLQVGIYAAGVVSARYLIDRGVTPALLIGHSFGELAALAIGGAFDDSVGAELVCHRVKALQGLTGSPGGMLALFCDEMRARALVERVAPSTLEIAVINHAGQTVVSGTLTDLHRLAALLAAERVNGQILKSRYPFHSALLGEAVDPFAAALRQIESRPLATAVYSPVDGGLYARQPDLVQIARHFVQPVIFSDALESAYALGGRVFIECGGGRVLTGLVQQVLRGRPGVKTLTAVDAEIESAHDGNAITSPPVLDVAPDTRVAGTAAPTPRAEGPVPIAIVSIGALLPGASDPETLWHRLLDRQGGIVDLGDLDPTLAVDFKAEPRMTPNKTYSLLCGRVTEDTKRPVAGLSSDEWEALPTVGRFFAHAARQCLDGLRSPLPSSERISCVVGSTADGSREFDEALVLAGVEARIRASNLSTPQIESVCSALDAVTGRRLARAGEQSGPRAFSRVGRALFGQAIRILSVDAACASSLHAIGIGIEALRDGRSDVAICGGAFAPGPASTCLFAQFQGLSARGSRPLDAEADGVVFGEGATLLVLKRLPDAMAAGDRIHAVIREVAASSDGKSASVMEPKQGGQLLAIRRAAERSGISPSTLQFIDAHATATPVGDAVEFASLREAVGPPVASRARVRVGSLKAAIGHTGWVAGAASVVEICQALAARMFPPQLGFSSPNPKFELSSSNIAIEAEPSWWPANRDGLPRRAGINGFGFGGCNAHVILEEYDPTVFEAWSAAPNEHAPATTVAIVGVNTQLPSNRSSVADTRGWRFDPAERRLPDAIRVLPDVADSMDASQVLALRAAHAVLETFPASWASLKPDTGVIIGFDGKTRRGIDALLSIHADRLTRQFAAARAAGGPANQPAFDDACTAAVESIRQLPVSGPYTLGGSMPNITAGRIASVFNLNGPNLVVDAEGCSLYEAISQAERQLQAGVCRLVLAGGISSSVSADVERIVRSRDGADPRPVGEAAVMVALASVATAHELGLPVLGYLTRSSPASPVLTVGSGPAFLMGAEGALELNEAVARLGEVGGSVTVQWPDARGAMLALTMTAAAVSQSTNQAPALRVPEPAPGPQIPPLRWTAPEWIPSPIPPPTGVTGLSGRRLLIVTDQPTWTLSPTARAALSRFEYRVACPAVDVIPGGLAIDLTSHAHMVRSLQALDGYDAFVVITDAANLDAIDDVTGSQSSALVELMFAVSRHAYDRLQKGEVAVGAVCLNAGPSPASLHPVTGLVSGFLRSLAHEAPAAACCQINTSDGDLGHALERLNEELAAGSATSPREVCYHDGRFVQQLREVDPVSAGQPLLTRDSVVVATGGARGVTAVLLEGLRRLYGCTTVLLGRTDPEALPPDIRSMDDDAFERFEPAFYQRELAARPGTRPADLKAAYKQYRAAREVAATLETLGALPGALEYMRVDVTDAGMVDRAIQSVVSRFGGVDLVVHGAGIQTSKALKNKTLEDFRSIVATKLGGLGHLIHACRAHQAGRPVHFHLVTSTFSHAGNDGQQDYGAANLAMDRLAQFLSSSSSELQASALGWVGWVNVGMTRGSEYANLAIQRRLGGVTRDKGQSSFCQYIGGRPTSPVTYLITDLEAAYFGMTIAPAGRRAERPRRIEQPLVIETEVYPFLRDHTVNGVPTMPAAFGLELAARIASMLRPDLELQRFTDIAVERFVKVPEGRAVELRGVGDVVEDGDDACRVRVRLLSDFAHASGRILQRDILHMSTEVVLCRAAQPAVARQPVTTVQSGWRLADPYLHAQAPVRLSGPFRSLHDIQLTPTCSSATFMARTEPDLIAVSGLFVPFVLLDALWRMAAMRRDADGMVPVYVPLGCTRVDVLKGIDDTTLAGPCTLTSSVPRVDGDRIRVEWAEARDASGRVLLEVTDLVGAEYGRVPAELEQLRPPKVDSDQDVRGKGTPGRSAKAGRTGPKTLDGKVALVTGSGRGLGKVIAGTLAELGALVFVNSFHSPAQGEQTAAEIVKGGGRALHVWGSVAQPLHLARMFEQIDAEAGGLDFLVSNASAGVFARMGEFTPEQWMRSFRTNVVALHQAALLSAERMQRRGGGRIVALSSIGSRWCFERFGLVGPVKAAVETLVRYLAVELAPYQVDVGAVSAGAVDGELLRQHPGRPLWENLAPGRRLMTEAEVADAVVFMLTTGALNGTTLVVDGASGLRTVEPAQMPFGGKR